MVTNNSVNTYIVPTAANEITRPSQPAFQGNLAANKLNKTGNGAVYTLGTDALVEIIDQNGDFNVNGTFTSPVNGTYKLNSIITTTDNSQANTAQMEIITSNRSYLVVTNCEIGQINFGCSAAFLADMDAADTATTSIEVTGEGANTVDILGIGFSVWSGFLAN